MTIGERMLLAFCRPVDQPDYPGGTARTNLDNALSFLLKTVPDFKEIVQGKDVLDFGCGHGQQAAALARAVSSRVVGLDLERPILAASWAKLHRELALPNLELTTRIPEGHLFDVVYSCSAFEHFSDPAMILGMMRDYTKPGGTVVVSFAEPWWSPRGSHMDGITRLPWVNVLFSEQTVMSVRARYRSDGAKCYEDVEGGLNRLTIDRFESIMRDSGMDVVSLRLFSVKGLPLVAQIPGVRELLVAAASCVLRKR